VTQQKGRKRSKKIFKKKLVSVIQDHHAFSSTNILFSIII